METRETTTMQPLCTSKLRTVPSRAVTRDTSRVRSARGATRNLRMDRVTRLARVRRSRLSSRRVRPSPSAHARVPVRRGLSPYQRRPLCWPRTPHPHPHPRRNSHQFRPIADRIRGLERGTLPGHITLRLRRGRQCR